LRHAAAQWRSLLEQARPLRDEFRRDNLRRLRVLAGLEVPLNLVHIVLFSGPGAATTAQAVMWRQGIFWSHVVMAVLMVVLGGCAQGLLTRWHSRRAEQAVVVGALAVGLGFAGLLAVLDQWVTPSIAPLLIGSLALSLVFLIQPRLAIVLFSGTGLAMLWGLGLTQHDPAVLLSNRVNLLSCMVLSAALAILLWHKTVANTLLRGELQAANRVLQHQQVELHQLATLDPLTGVINRREFERLAGLVLARAQCTKLPAALIVIDLDRFKTINDAWGHPAGDVVLGQAAKHLQSHLRRTDVLARYGGEEFMLLLPDTDLADALGVAEKLRASLQALVMPWEGRTLRISASFGVTTTGARVEELGPLYKRADEALYKAKQGGRNRIEMQAAEAP
jgi:diguanylate cyclase (GGDEF)-like protein